MRAIPVSKFGAKIGVRGVKLLIFGAECGEKSYQTALKAEYLLDWVSNMDE
jgi:hypothetical protein